MEHWDTAPHDLGRRCPAIGPGGLFCAQVSASSLLPWQQDKDSVCRAAAYSGLWLGRALNRQGELTGAELWPLGKCWGTCLGGPVLQVCEGLWSFLTGPLALVLTMHHRQKPGGSVASWPWVERLFRVHLG